MLKLASLTLFAVYALSSVHAAIIGPAGQDCTPDDDDNPELCTTSGQIITERTKIECEENYDCCLCSQLRCAPNCDGFKANGDFSAYYVPRVYITGNDDDGAEIDCDGDSSCEGAVIKATNVKGIKCGGDRSCFKSNINAECLDPCKVECDGDNACRLATIQVTNVEGVVCDEKACYGTRYTITDPDDDFKLECGSAYSCTWSKINIVVNGDITSKLKSIDCGGYRACKGAVITIKNIGTKTVKVEELKCSADQACWNTEIAVEGNVIVEDCECSTTGCRGVKTTGFTCINAPSGLGGP